MKKTCVFKTWTTHFDAIEYPMDKDYFEKRALSIFYNSEQWTWLVENGYLQVQHYSNMNIETLNRHFAILVDLKDEDTSLFAVLFGDKIDAPFTS